MDVINKRLEILQVLNQEALKQGITHQIIADKTGFNQPNVGRMLSGKYSPTTDNLIKLADAIGYDIMAVKKMINEKIPDEFVEPKFIFSVDPIANEMYILHRHFPSCLIQIVQELPVRFVIIDLYDDVDNPPDILNMKFIDDAKQYWRDYSESLLDKN